MRFNSLQTSEVRYISSAFAARPPRLRRYERDAFFSSLGQKGKATTSMYTLVCLDMYLYRVFAYSVLKAAPILRGPEFHEEDLHSSAVLKEFQTLVQSDFSI
jgi:hypothetical protein